MEEYTQITLDEWTQWKEDIRRKLAETASNFVYIGYRLKQIRDSGMYDGAADIFSFAQKEYGLGKSTVSRFIAINEKYSEGGNSLELKKEFQGFSSSKLAEMLTLPDSELQLITEKTTIREIRELKSFNSQEPEEEAIEAAWEPLETAGPEEPLETVEEAGREEPIETAESEDVLEAAGSEHTLEAAGLERTPERAPEQPTKRTPLEKCVADYFRTHREMQEGVRRCLEADPPDYKAAAEWMAPSGQASHRKGIIFLFLYDWSAGVKYKLMTVPEPVSMSWPEFLEEIRHVAEEPDQAEEEASVATSQREESGERETAENTVPIQENQEKAQSVATSQQEEKKPGEPVEEQSQEPEAAGDEEEIPGQDNILNHPEYLPAEMQEEPEAAGTGEGQQETRSEDKKLSEEELLGDCRNCLATIRVNLYPGNYRTAKKAAEELLHCLQNLIESEGRKNG